MMCTHTYEDILSLDNVLEAWKDFVKGKRSRKDVQEFEQHLMRQVIALHTDLVNKTYTHGNYKSFYITDPKRRHIHKASVRDRLLHHAVYRKLYPYFDARFITHSYSCRLNKGTHKGFEAVERMARKVSKNYTTQCFALKCDIKRFFDSINHTILIAILERHIADKDVLALLTNIIESFGSFGDTLFEKKGLPLGNLTSQLFANVYMNEFDQFVKHELKVKHYARYTDDFVFISEDKSYLESLIPQIEHFLAEHLKLTIHPNKMFITTMYRGVDFLGYITKPHHRLIRTRTKQRMFRGLDRKIKEHTSGVIEEESVVASLHSYLGVLSHVNAYTTAEKLKVMVDYSSE